MTRRSGVTRNGRPFGNLQSYFEAQYRAIDGLCRVNRHYLSSLVPSAPQLGKEPETTHTEKAPNGHAGTGALPIVLDPSPETAFRKALLQQRQAWIVEEYGGVPAPTPVSGGERIRADEAAARDRPRRAHRRKQCGGLDGRQRRGGPCRPARRAALVAPDRADRRRG